MRDIAHFSKQREHHISHTHSTENCRFCSFTSFIISLQLMPVKRINFSGLSRAIAYVCIKFYCYSLFSTLCRAHHGIVFYFTFRINFDYYAYCTHFDADIYVENVGSSKTKFAGFNGHPTYGLKNPLCVAIYRQCVLDFMASS